MKLPNAQLKLKKRDWKQKKLKEKHTQNNSNNKMKMKIGLPMVPTEDVLNVNHYCHKVPKCVPSVVHQWVGRVLVHAVRHGKGHSSVTEWSRKWGNLSLSYFIKKKHNYCTSTVSEIIV